TDPQVRTTVMTTLGQIGSERAQNALLEAARSGKPEDRVAAITGLAQLEDARASQQLPTLLHDPDSSGRQAAISSADNGGREVDQSLEQIMLNPNADQSTKALAANQLRARGTDLDAALEQAVTALAGPAQQYGGAGYGGISPPTEGFSED